MPNTPDYTAQNRRAWNADLPSCATRSGRMQLSSRPADQLLEDHVLAAAGDVRRSYAAAPAMRHRRGYAFVGGGRRARYRRRY